MSRPTVVKGGSRWITPWCALVFGDVQLPDHIVGAYLSGPGRSVSLADKVWPLDAALSHIDVIDTR